MLYPSSEEEDQMTYLTGNLGDLKCSSTLVMTMYLFGKHGYSEVVLVVDMGGLRVHLGWISIKQWVKRK